MSEPGSPAPACRPTLQQQQEDDFCDDGVENSRKRQRRCSLSPNGVSVRSPSGGAGRELSPSFARGSPSPSRASPAPTPQQRWIPKLPSTRSKAPSVPDVTRAEREANCLALPDSSAATSLQRGPENGSRSHAPSRDAEGGPEFNAFVEAAGRKRSLAQARDTDEDAPLGVEAQVRPPVFLPR
eukprot:TRINITY_DN19072_c0_g1_i1.p1 TRINITY_DN19072_c0_g1~~TRINITY_DN19072_c0_g1_i1.p1  ORF type:complete len:212 (+),score=57.99 TRINITY_DN19072_c0_g1_i1:88-636(+)